MFNLNLIYLKYFYDAVKLGSISRSAEMNYVTQSAVSQGITKLEKSLDTALVAHQPKQFHITSEGRQVFLKARELFDKVAELQNQVFSENEGGFLSLCCLHSFAMACFPDVLEKFYEKHPKVQAQFFLGHKEKSQKLLRYGMVDFGVVVDEDDIGAQFVKKPIYQGEYKLYVAKGFQGNVKQLKYIVTDDNKPLLFLKKVYKQKFQKELPIRLRIASWELVSKLIEKGLGIGYFPDYIGVYKKDSLVEIDLVLPKMTYDVYAIYYAEKGLSNASTLFLDLFESLENQD